MEIRSRLSRMGMFPDVGKIQDALDAKFEQLIAELREIKDVLIQIRDKGGPQ